MTSGHPQNYTTLTDVTLADHRTVGTTVFWGAWATALVLMLFLYAYRRALDLINPLRPLGFVVARAQKEFRVWNRRANRAGARCPTKDQALARKARSHQATI
jgi:hypothetical protein